MGRTIAAAGLLLAVLHSAVGLAQGSVDPAGNGPSTGQAPPARTEGPPEPGVASLGVGLSVDSWRRSWQARDAETFCLHYSARFPNRDAFCARKAAIFARNEWIEVAIDDLQVGPEGEGYNATFLQDYRSDTLSDYGRKRLLWMWEDGTWRIVAEEWSELPRPAGEARSQWEILTTEDEWLGVRMKKEGSSAEPAPARPVEETGPPGRIEKTGPRAEGVRPSGSSQPNVPATLRKVNLRDTGTGAFLVLYVEGETSVAATSAPDDGVVRVTLTPARDELTHLPAPTPGGLVRDIRVRGTGELVVVEMYVGEAPVEVRRPMRTEGQIIVRLSTP